MKMFMIIYAEKPFGASNDTVKLSRDSCFAPLLIGCIGRLIRLHAAIANIGQAYDKIAKG